MAGPASFNRSARQNPTKHITRRKGLMIPYTPRAQPKGLARLGCRRGRQLGHAGSSVALVCPSHEERSWVCVNWARRQVTAQSLEFSFPACRENGERGVNPPGAGIGLGDDLPLQTDSPPRISKRFSPLGERAREAQEKTREGC